MLDAYLAICLISYMAKDKLSLTFAALADPTRRAILARLVEGEATVNGWQRRTR